MPANCFGPYLRYAITTDFRNFGRFHKTKSDEFRLILIIEFIDGAKAEDFRTAMGNEKIPVDLGPVIHPTEVKRTRYYTAHTSKAAVGDAAAKIWDAYVSRVELSLPLEDAQGKAEVEARAPGELPLRKGVLIGVLDDGCPFAANRFRAATGLSDTRLSAIWDQNPHRRPFKVRDRSGVACLFGQTPADFDYGLEFQRRPRPPARGRKRHIGLNEWIELHTTSGLIDEDGCYADADFDTLRYLESHGAHVMDVFAGRTPTSSRVSLDPLEPPTFAPGSDLASTADIVFVQFPKDAIEDPTGVWLDAYVLDGIRYILGCARSGSGEFIYDRVVVNISYGRTTGPHNGTALLEQALTELVSEFDGAGKEPKLEIALADGNSYLTASHVVFENDSEQPATFKWTWRLPPDNAALCFAEVWMSNADAAGVKVSLTSPSGATFISTGPAAPAGVEGPLPWGVADTVWRLQVEPTLIGADVSATVTYPVATVEYGDYAITVSGVPQDAEVHGYVARTDPNMDVISGAKPSWFIDAVWEATDGASAGCTYADGEFSNKGSFVSRFGTLNGLATAVSPSVHVAGGYMLANARKSPYASAGPARDGPLTFREGPDYAMPCDQSYALEGIPAGGNRSGVVFRLIGTSTAAPQLARWVSGKAPLPPVSDPTGCDPIEVEERGSGNLAPP